MEQKHGVFILDHPLAQEILTELRDKGTRQIQFRKGLVRLGRLMGYELMKTMRTERITVETPLGPAVGVRIPDKKNIIIVHVLRASMPLVEGLIKAFPDARMGVISAKRVEEEDARAKNYEFSIRMDYINIPRIKNEDTLIIADPMLASGSTLLKVISELRKKGRPKRLIVASVISCPFGINRVRKEFPDVEIVTAAVDPELNKKGYIVPGLGDAGDRAFGSD